MIKAVEEALKYLERLTKKFREFASQEKNSEVKEKYLSRTQFFGDTAFALMKKYNIGKEWFVFSIYKEMMLLEESRGHYEKALENASAALKLARTGEEKGVIEEKISLYKEILPALLKK
ncbi:hypothetical protein KKH56_01805 [bacterium]|nr:hypothetical protein [bacterium]